MAQLKKPGLGIPVNTNPGQLPGQMSGSSFGSGMQSLPKLGIGGDNPFGGMPGNLPPGSGSPFSGMLVPPEKRGLSPTQKYRPDLMPQNTAPPPPQEELSGMGPILAELLKSLQPSKPGVMDWVKLGLGTLGPILAGLGQPDGPDPKNPNGLSGDVSSQRLTEDAVKKANEQYEDLLRRRKERGTMKLKDSYVSRRRKPVQVDGIPFEIGGQ